MTLLASAPAILGNRFWSKVRVNDETGCWEWTAATTACGYGNYWAGVAVGRYVPAHRWAYELMVGDIPAGLHCDHLCRVRKCVNPAHIEPVTCRENLLRGTGASARAAKQTHCPAGHPYVGDNLYISPRGQRGCLTCRHEQARASAVRVRVASGIPVGINNRDKTHCPAGHEYTPENTYTSKRNQRTCKACSRERARARRAA